MRVFNLKTFSQDGGMGYRQVRPMSLTLSCYSDPGLPDGIVFKDVRVATGRSEGGEVAVGVVLVGNLTAIGEALLGDAPGKVVVEVGLPLNGVFKHANQ